MIYRAFFNSILRRISAPRAHRAAVATMRILAWIPGYLRISDWLLRPRDRGIEVHIAGLHFRTPLGVAAGMDKDAKWFDPLTTLGFGFVEVGTATARAQAGNPDGVSRLPDDRALINAMGFPNDGAAVIADRVAARRTHEVIGVNIGKTKGVELEDAVADYREAARLLAPVADYMALNVSSPNTPGLTEMQTVDRLTELINGVRAELASCGFSHLPLMLKLGPDLSDPEIEEIADMAVRLGLAGIIAVNTTRKQEVASNSAACLAKQDHGGGISGRPLKQRSLEVLHLLHTCTGGNVPLVSVGGVETAADAWDRILAGASLLQAHTAFVYEGPLWAHRVNRGISKRLRASQWSSLEEAIGKGSEAFGGTVTPLSSQQLPAESSLSAL